MTRVAAGSPLISRFRGGKRAMLVLLLATPLLGGCIGDDSLEETFSNRRPVLQPGFQWTYEARIESGFAFTSKQMVRSETGYELHARDGAETEHREFVQTEQLVTSDKMTKEPGDIHMVRLREPRYEESDGVTTLDRRDQGPAMTCKEGCDTYLQRRSVDALGPGGQWLSDIPGDVERLVDFPLVVGSEWVVAHDIYESDGHERITDFRARALEKISVDLPGQGDVEGVRIHASLTPESAASIGDFLMKTNWDGDVEVTIGMWLEYVYTPAARTITHVQYHMESTFVGELDGEMVDGGFSRDAEYELIDMELERGEDYGRLEAYRLVQLADGRKGVRGLGPIPWRFDLGATGETLPAGAGETITFGPVQEGAGGGLHEEFDPLPAGHEAAWRVRWLEPDGSGDTRTEGRSDPGETLEFEIEKEGLHHVRLLVYDEEKRLVGKGEKTVQGTGIRRIHDEVPLGIRETEHDVEFTTAPHLKNLTIDVTPGIAGEGTLRLSRDGVPEADYPVSGETRIEHSLSSGRRSQDWRVLYVDEHRVGNLDVVITSNYDTDRSFDRYFG